MHITMFSIVKAMLAPVMFAYSTYNRFTVTGSPSGFQSLGDGWGKCSIN